MLTREDLLLGKLRRFGVTKLQTKQSPSYTEFIFSMENGPPRTIHIPLEEFKKNPAPFLRKVEMLLSPMN